MNNLGSMNDKLPRPLTSAEWTEIGSLPLVRECWGVTEEEDFSKFGPENIYGAKFNFVSGSPGYVGDLYILQGDVLAGDPPLVLIRDNVSELRVYHPS